MLEGLECWKTYFWTIWLVCFVKEKLTVCIKTTPICIQKQKFRLCFFVEQVWLDLEFLNLLFPLEYHPKTLERQLNYLKLFATMSLWQPNDLSTMLCHQSFLVQYLFSTYWKQLAFLEVFFSMIFKP